MMITPLPDMAANNGLPMGGVAALEGGEVMGVAEVEPAVAAGGTSLAFCSCLNFHTFFTGPTADVFPGVSMLAVDAAVTVEGGTGMAAC